MRGSTAGLADSVLRAPNNAYNNCLSIIDMMLSSFVIAPLVVGYWRGTWNLASMFIYPGEPVKGGLTCCAIGMGGQIFFNYFQFAIQRTFHPNKHRLAYFLFSRIYTYAFGFCCVSAWCGIWLLIQEWLTLHAEPMAWLTVVALSLLCGLRALRNIFGVPFYMALDSPSDYFSVRTMFQNGGTREPGLYVLDCLFSVLVVGSLVVFAWRGIWVFLDIMIYPDNKTLSALSSLAIGYGIVAVTFALQPVMRWTCERLTGLWRVATADLFLFFSFLGTINVWRGVWYLLDEYFIPENPLMSDLLTHGVSILLLALLNCSNTVLVRGVYIDAEEPDGQCVIFPVYYVRLFFQKERLKKQKRMQDMEKGAHHHIQHQSSLRQQLLKGHEKSPTIVPMNKITGHSVNTLISSSHPSALNHHPHQQYKISNSNNQSQLSVSSPCPAAATEETDDRDEEEESRLYRPLEQTDDSPLCLKEVDRNRIN